VGAAGGFVGAAGWAVGWAAVLDEPETVPAPTASATSADGVAEGDFQPTGGTTWTMLVHLGHSRIAPIADSLRTASRARHVVQVMENKAFSTVPRVVVERVAQLTGIIHERGAGFLTCLKYGRLGNLPHIGQQPAMLMNNPG